MKYKISVIVPVYNIEGYIERCLNSLTNQTYRNIEIIVVNDGSKDKSRDILERISMQDSRVIEINKENGGLSSARNEGLKFVTGDYVLFVDGDDYLDLNTIDLLVDKINENVEVVMFPYIKKHASYELRAKLFDREEIVFSNSEVREYLLPYLIGPGINRASYSPKYMDRLNTAWGKLYKYSLIKNIQFVDTDIIGIEDGWYNINVFNNITGDAIYTEDTWYNYEKENEGSLLHSYKENFFHKRFNFYHNVDEYIKNNNLEGFSLNLNYRIVVELFGLIVNELCSDKNIRTIVRELDFLFKKYEYKKYFNNISYNKFNLAWAMFFFLCSKNIFGPIIIILKIFMKAGDK